MSDATSGAPAPFGSSQPCPGCGSPPAANGDVDDVCPDCGKYEFFCGIATQRPLPVKPGIFPEPVVRQHMPPRWLPLPACPGCKRPPVASGNPEDVCPCGKWALRCEDLAPVVDPNGIMFPHQRRTVRIWRKLLPSQTWKKDIHTENSAVRTGDTWTIRYGTEKGDYADRKSIGWLVQLLARPNRSLTVAELRGDPEGKLAADAYLGKEAETNAEGILAIKKRLQEIEDTAAEVEWSEKSSDEYADLLRRVEAAKGGKQIVTSANKEHHNVASQLRILRRALKSNMPTLFAHLIASLQLDRPHLGYYPPVGAPNWKI